MLEDGRCVLSEELWETGRVEMVSNTGDVGRRIGSAGELEPGWQGRPGAGGGNAGGSRAIELRAKDKL